MPCCGQGRRQAVAASQNGVTQNSVTKAARVTPNSMYRVFEYTGTSSITVVGRTTGSTYRFAHRGSRVQVDIRDLQSIAGVPDLRTVY